MRQIFLAVLLIALPVTSQAQAPDVRPGKRVRIDAPGVIAGPFTGTILKRTSDTLVVGGPDVEPISIALSRVRSLEISGGKSRWRGAYKGTLWGGGIGAGLGFATASELRQCRTTSGVRNCDLPVPDAAKELYVAAFAYVGVVYGAIIGAIIGSERWDRFDVMTSTAFEVHDGRPTLSFSRTF